MSNIENKEIPSTISEIPTPVKDKLVTAESLKLVSDIVKTNRTETANLKNNKLDKNLGSENNGKILVIGADGNVIPVIKPSIGGSGGGTDISNLNDVLGITQAKPNYTWEGFYRITSDGTKKAVEHTANSASKLTDGIPVYRGDIVKVKSRITLYAVIAFAKTKNPDKYTVLKLGTDSNSFREYEVTVPSDGYVFISCYIEKESQTVGQEFDITIIGRKSRKLDKYDARFSELSPASYYGVSSNNDIDIVLGDTIPLSDTGDKTIELIIKVNDMTTGWFYGAGNSMFGLYRNIDRSIKASLNVGNYETITLYDKNYDGQIMHIVLALDWTNKRKTCYMNGTLLKSFQNLTYSGWAVPFNDMVKSGVEIYQKRLWSRVLSDKEIEKLYNNGYPLDVILTDSIEQGIVNNLTPKTLRKNMWEDNSSEFISELIEPTLIYENPFNIYKTVNKIDTIVTKQNNHLIEKKYYPEFSIKTVKRGAHDCTFIGEYLVSFNKPSDGYASFIDVTNYTRPSTKKINFIESTTKKELEMKSCDYKFNKLIVGNGRAIKYGESDYTEQGSRLYIFHEANTWKEFMEAEITLENCGTYDVIDISELGYKVYGFWGGFEDTVYISCNLFNDIYLIQLGKETNNLGKGSFTSVSEGRYNGSFTVIGHWHQDNKLGSWSAHGGQYYKGNLYIATNDTNVCQIYKCILKENGELGFDVLDFDVRQPNDSTKMQYKYIDGLCIKDDVLYAQPLTVGESPITNFDTFIIAKI